MGIVLRRKFCWFIEVMVFILDVGSYFEWWQLYYIEIEIQKGSQLFWGSEVLLVYQIVEKFSFVGIGVL